jgi:hypothetical protein
MAIGPGKYDSECTIVREATEAHTAIVIVIGGTLGGGFSVQTQDQDILFKLPGMLRGLADNIEEDLGAVER